MDVDIGVFDVHALIRCCVMNMNEAVYSVHEQQFALYMVVIASLCHSPWLPISCDSQVAEGDNSSPSYVSVRILENVGSQVLPAFRDVVALPAVGQRAETSRDLPDTSRLPILTRIHLEKLAQLHCDITQNDA